MPKHGVKIAVLLAAIGAVLPILSPAPTLAQIAAETTNPVSESLDIRTGKAFTWADATSNIAQLTGPVVINADHTRITADNVVMWLTLVPNSVLGEQDVDLSLIGHATVQQQDNTRSGDQMFVTLRIRGSIRLTADDRLTQDQSASQLYKDASLLRPADRFPMGTLPPGSELLQHPDTTQPTTAPTTRPFVSAPVAFRAANLETIETADNKVAFVLTGGVTLFQNRETGEFMECQADRAVLFTPRSSLRGMAEGPKPEATEQEIESAYLEGDVRITFTPGPPQPGDKPKGEQRLAGNRIFYDFTTDRAVMTDAIVHTLDPKINIPMIVRAGLVRQMSVGEYQANKVELSTSSFATPSYSIKADRAYVRQADTGDPRYGVETQYVAHDATFRSYGVPYFYLPTVSGTMTQKGSALRSIYTESNSRNGTGIRSTWGLFETIGAIPPEDLDMAFHANYLSQRGPGTGLDAKYQGGFIDDTTKQPWDFEGKLSSDLMFDDGKDKVGGDRASVDPERELRGRILWEHQHFFPDDWQAQLRLGYSSDPTFLEEWYKGEFDTQQPQDASLYLKHQKDTEAFTLLAEAPTRKFITNADELQEQSQVAVYPELGYHRIGDSLLDDRLTFFSEDSLAALHFVKTNTPLSELGFRKGQEPGLPSYGETGENDDTTLRADTRDEVDYPFSAGQFKVVPYVFGRYTGYNDSPQNDNKQRLFAGTGVRINTAFWRVDDSAESNFFDIHRLRHVIEPEINLFTSATSVDRSRLFDYEEQVDKVNDISAAQFAIHQSWQTKRGGAGQWRSVDVFTLNVEANLFSNKPPDTLNDPKGFRGLFFPTAPELSIPRNSINADALWRLSDETAILADEEYNLDQKELATASVGVAVERDPRMGYFLGVRYIGQLNSTVASVGASYQISARYTVAGNESIDLASRRSEDSSFTLIRHFDRFFASFTVYFDQINNQSGFRFGFVPEGVRKGVSTDEIANVAGVNQ